VTRAWVTTPTPHQLSDRAGQEGRRKVSKCVCGGGEAVQALTAIGWLRTPGVGKHHTEQAAYIQFAETDKHIRRLPTQTNIHFPCQHTCCCVVPHVCIWPKFSPAVSYLAQVLTWCLIAGPSSHLLPHNLAHVLTCCCVIPQVCIWPRSRQVHPGLGPTLSGHHCTPA
jgi:hypothetical protein